MIYERVFRPFPGHLVPSREPRVLCEVPAAMGVEEAACQGLELFAGCVAENDPRSLGQALRLVQSIRWFGGELAEARVMICVPGEPDRSFRQALEEYGAEVRIVSPSAASGGATDRLQLFPEAWRSEPERFLLLDCDTVVVQDPLPWMRRGAALADPGFQLGISRPPSPEESFAVDPAILRYDDRVDAEGYLLHTPYPFAQVRVEAFNRRLRQEREGLSGRARPVRERLVPLAAPGAQVAVLGMHRSGTSALTHLLQRMGLWAGEEEDFPPADDHNETGYWEHRGVWSIDEVILQEIGASWFGVTDLDFSRLGGEVRDRLRERARGLVRDLDRHGSWVVKDPRLCVLFPFWREILERPFCVLLYREPLPVARSLAARDGFPLSYGIALWEKYTREALASTRGLPRVLLSHRELLANPEATLRRLHGEMARQMPQLARLRVLGAEEIHAVLDPDLVHHPHEPEVERDYLTLPQLALLDALADGSALDLDPVPPLSAGARDLLAAFQSQWATEHSLRDLLTAQTTMEASLRQAQEELVQAQRSAQAAYQGALAAYQNSEAAHLKTQEAHQRALSSLDELNAIFSATLASRSWKIGRAITSMLGRLLGRSDLSAPERHDRLMAEIRRRDDANG